MATNKKKKWWFWICVAVALYPIEVFAQGGTTYKPLIDLPQEFFTNYELLPYLQSAFRFAIAAAGVLAVFRIVWGGFVYMTTDVVSNKQEGREIITKAIGGLILAIAAWLILYTVNKDVLNLKLISYPKELQSTSPNPTPGAAPAGGGANTAPQVNVELNNDRLAQYNDIVRNRTYPTNREFYIAERAKELAMKNGITVPENASIQYKTVGNVPYNITVNGNAVPLKAEDYSDDELDNARWASELQRKPSPIQ